MVSSEFRHDKHHLSLLDIGDVLTIFWGLNDPWWKDMGKCFTQCNYMRHDNHHAFHNTTHTVQEQELGISKTMTSKKTWTFYLRRLLLFVRLSYYFNTMSQAQKSSTILSAHLLASTQQVSLVVIKMLLIYFSQNGHFWNGVHWAKFVKK